MDSILHGFVRLLSYSSWFCLASTTHLIQIQSGTEHRISFSLLNSLHGFYRSPGFVRLLSHSSWFCLASSHNSWFCLASTTRLIQIRDGAEHRISFLLLNSLHGFYRSPGFVRLLSHSSWLKEQLSVSYGTRTSIESESR